MRDYFINLFDYTAWANRCLLDALRATAGTPAGLPPEALKRFAHVLAAEHVWLSRIRAETPRMNAWPDLTLEACENLADENARGYHDLLVGPASLDLTRAIAYQTSTGAAYQTPIDAILTHVATHGGYHRGQVARLLAESGHTAPSTDYILFFRDRTA